MDKHTSDQSLPEGSVDEMALLYQLGIALASGKDLYTTLLTLYTEIMKLVQADALYVAIYDETTDIVDFPIYFEVGVPITYPSRKLSEQPGFTGAVIYSGKPLYLPDTLQEEILQQYGPVDDHKDPQLHTYLGIPLQVNGQSIGVLSVQCLLADAYTPEHIRLMENVAVQAALAIDKARLLDQLKQELEERKQMEIDLRQREAILEAVTFAAEQFLKTTNWRLNIDKVLERLGTTIHVTHAYLFEDHFNTQGEPVTSMRYEWTAPGHISYIHNPQYQNSKLDMEGYEEHVEAMHRGELRMGNSRTFNDVEKDDMASSGIKAILEVPIFVNQKDWGAIGFDDFAEDRDWTSAETDALKVAAGILSAAIQREKADSAVQESERIYRQAIEAADAVPYYYDYASNSYAFIGEGIRSMTGYGPDALTPALWSRIIEETVMLGDAGESWIQEVVDSVSKRKAKAWKRDHKIRTREGRIRWLTDRSVQLIDDRNIAYGSVGIFQNITDRKLTEEGLRKRESTMQAITFAAEQFLKSPDWRENIDAVLERLGKEFDASHAYLFEHHPNAEGAVVSSMTHEWTAPGCVSDLGNPIFGESRTLSEELESTDGCLRKGLVFIANTSTFPEAERERLEQLGVQSMIELPLMVRGEWWGTMGIDDMFTAREWTPAEIDALKVAADILSAAIQRQEAESAVQESERIYRQAIEAAGAVPYFQDYQKKSYTFFGEGIRGITGYAPNELTPAVWDSMVIQTELTGDLAGLAESEALLLVRSGSAKAWQCDYQIQARDGQMRWIADSAVELFGDADISYGSIGIMQDITERKLVESSLRQRESLFQALTFVAEQLLKASNWRETIDLVLEKLGQEFNVSHAYLFEKHLSADGVQLTSMTYEWTAPGLASDLDNPEFQDLEPKAEGGFERFYNILDSGEPLVADDTFVNQFEKQYLLSLGVKALLEIRVIVNGQQWGTLGFDEIRTDRLWTRAEIDVVKVAASMLGVAIKRQMDEAALQRELEQRKELIAELESKNEELERFTYTVSHDLKSPLVTISGFLGFLEQDALSGRVDRVKQDSQRIHEAVLKMQRLLNELLELSRIGRMMNAPSDVSLNELIAEAMEIVRGRLDERGITVHVHPDLPPAHGDKPRLLEVLQNLLDNAAKYMGEQANPTIEIGQRGEDVERGMPIFYVRDNGIGIAPEHHERVFGLFNKLDARTEGTGVGLALVRRIVEVHGGRIWVESALGRGSTFLFTLPPANAS